MPDVRRYLSVFWGVLLMLIKQFHYLSDGCAPLVEDLGHIFYSEKSRFWRVLKEVSCGVPPKSEVVDNLTAMLEK